MTDPIEQRLYENTQRLLDSNSTEFLTPDEQMFIGQQLNRAVLRQIENNLSSDQDAFLSLSNLCDWIKNDGRSTSPEDVSAACDALLGLQELPGLSDEQRRYSKNLLLRFLNYAGALPNRPLDLQPADPEYLTRLNALGKKSALSDTKFHLQPNPGFPARLPENFRATTGDLSDRYDTGLNAMTDIFKFSRNELLAAMYLDFLSGKSDWDMNALLHELRHVWQHLQDKWKPKFGDGINTKTDVDIELDAYEKQILFEKIFGIESDIGRNLKRIETIASNTNEPSSRASIIRRKAYALLEKYKRKEMGDNYRIKSPTEYDKEYPE